MYNIPIKDIVSLKSLIDVSVWPLMGNRVQHDFIPKQKYFTVITKTEKAGGILANSENQKVFLLKNLRIQLGKLEINLKRFIKKSSVYTKLAQTLFQEYHLLAVNLRDNGVYLWIK